VVCIQMHLRVNMLTELAAGRLQSMSCVTTRTPEGTVLMRM
jgi:hypothetical protein